MRRLVNARAAALFALSTASSVSIGCGSSSADDLLTSSGGKAGKGGTTADSAGGTGAITAGGSAGLGSGGSGGVSGTGGAGGSSGGVDAASDSSSDAGGSAGTATGGTGATDGGSADSGPDGALQSTPGMVACLNAECDLSTVPPSICCLQTSGSIYPTACYPSLPGCIGTSIACDEPADCNNGGVCCAAKTLAGYSAGCVPSCNSPGIRLCRQTSDCPRGQTCQPIAALPGYYGCS